MPAESASTYSQRFTEYALWAAPLQRVAACLIVCFQVSFCRIHDDEDSQLVKHWCHRRAPGTPLGSSAGPAAGETAMVPRSLSSWGRHAARSRRPGRWCAESYAHRIHAQRKMSPIQRTASRQFRVACKSADEQQAEPLRAAHQHRLAQCGVARPHRRATVQHKARHRGG